jgi:rod shape-determining protein MreC
VGTVIDVGKRFATIRVLIDPEFAVGVKLPAHKGSDATTSVAQGQAGSRELLDIVDDPLKKVMVGDAIVTSASPQNLYPPDLPVGTVSRVEPQLGQQVQHVLIRPYVDLGSLDYVDVLLWVQGQGAVVRTTTTSTSTTSSTTVAGASTTTTSTTRGG